MKKDIAEKKEEPGKQPNNDQPEQPPQDKPVIKKEAPGERSGPGLSVEDVPDSTNESTGVPGSGQRQDTN
ncbi:MAG: hypothetical protein P0Y53_15795 [Candidatus Pseudobacter hemicellulosilyticus]|uniref:Uncharacterized protein n=1 Tax=Candidatus Pseudobacter hemicellulosilyticus TaxID=3121375 RepID=A0AAJ6BGB4_9BACT|nr:MAG: hypothetical protein P0Y53_15795 [Pseudobacter sp.]